MLNQRTKTAMEMNGHQHVTPAPTGLQQWLSSNVLQNGDEATGELVVPAVSLDVQQRRREMTAPGAPVQVVRQPSVPLRLLDAWSPSFNPQNMYLGGGAQLGMQNTVDSSCCHGLLLPSVPIGYLPQPSEFPVASAPPISYMIPNYVAPPSTTGANGNSGPSSSSSFVSLTDEEASVYRNPMGAAQLLFPEPTSGYQEDMLRRQRLMARSGVPTEWDQRVMNRGYSTALLELLRENDAETTDEVLRLVSALGVHRTMADEFGSQVFVALLDACNGRQKAALVRAATCDGVQLTKVAGKTKFGSNCIKKLVEKVKTSPELSQRVANALAEGACHLMTAEHGRDVLKHCFKHMPYDLTNVLIKAAADGLMEYAKDVKGCGALKYCITQSRGLSRMLMMIIVGKNALELATHCYGNYVVQHVLDVEDSEYVKEFIFLTMAINFVQVAMNKSGSFVLEKLLNNPRYGLYMCRVIASYSRSLPAELGKVVRDRHGNYVMQRALEVSNAELEIHGELVRAIAGLPRSLMTDPYANKLYKTALRDPESHF